MTDEQTGLDVEEANSLVRHSAKPEWGYAVLAWSSDDKRGYQFEDGKLRVFHRDYLGLLENVDLPVEQTEQALSHLRAQLGWRASAQAASTPAAKVEVSLEAQVEYIKSEFPEGFSGSLWLKKKRGRGAKNRLKRHRDAAVAEAQELLAEGVMKAAIDSGDFASILESMKKIVEGTDLVSSAQAKPLQAIPADNAEPVVTALYEVLHGDGPFPIRFEHYIVALGKAMSKKPSWRIATLFPALVKPTEYAFVEAKLVGKQAASMAPGLTVSRVPKAATYKRINGLYQRLGETLGESWSKPTDYLDLYDMMWATLRPKALEKIRAMKRTVD